MDVCWIERPHWTDEIAICAPTLLLAIIVEVVQDLINNTVWLLHERAQRTIHAEFWCCSTTIENKSPTKQLSEKRYTTSAWSCERLWKYKSIFFRSERAPIWLTFAKPFCITIFRLLRRADSEENATTRTSASKGSFFPSAMERVILYSARKGQRKENKTCAWTTPMSPKPRALLSQSSSMQWWQLMCKMFQAHVLLQFSQLHLSSFCSIHENLSHQREHSRHSHCAGLGASLTIHRALCTRKFWKC